MTTRRQFLKKGAMGAGAIAAATTAGKVATSAASAAAPTSLKGMNIIVFMTDQEQCLQHFPPDWAKENLPGWRISVSTSSESTSRGPGRLRR